MTIIRILIFASLFSPLTFSQLMVDSIIVSDEAGGQRTLYFGLDPSATDSIDVHLGEGDLPPFPPYGAFDARLILPPYNWSVFSSYKDIRYSLYNIYAHDIRFRIKYQTGFGSVIKLSWFFSNSPYLIYGTLQDMFGGISINIIMNGNGSYTIQEPDIFNQVKIVLSVQNIPVELVSFDASVTGNSVILNWTTATETNNKGFEVQRKTDNSDWEEAGFVDGAGTTTEVNTYSFNDNNLSHGSYSYRLKQIDYSGEYTYSKIAEAIVSLIPSEFKLSQNYPNPFNPSTIIEYEIPEDAFINLTLFDMLGNEIKTLLSEQKSKGIYKIQINADDFSSGIYFYRLKTDKFSEIRKMVLLR
jgi:hypothetical protein